MKKILFFLVLFMLFSCSTNKNKSEKKLELKKIKSIKLPVDWILQVIDYDSSLVIADQINSEIVIIDKSGNKIKTIGRKGEGPGEFQNLSGLHFDNNNFLVFDLSLRRLTIYDTVFNLKNTIILKSSHASKGHLIDNKLITISASSSYKIYKDYKIGNLYYKKNSNWVYKKPIIDVNYKFDERLKKYSFLPWTASYRVDNNIYILHSFIDKVIIYDTKRDSVTYKSFNFPNYTDIKKVSNLNSLYKKYHKKYFLGPTQFCSSPTAIFYNKHKKVFLVEFFNPSQEWFENEKEGKVYYKNTMVLFDNDFNYLAHLKTNQYIHGVKAEKDKFIVYSSELHYPFLGEEEPDDIYLNVYEIDLSKY